MTEGTGGWKDLLLGSLRLDQYEMTLSQSRKQGVPLPVT